MIHLNKELISKLKDFIAMSTNRISDDGMHEVIHYFEHGEYEMAFEGLVIELMLVNKHPEDFNYSEWRNLAIQFNLEHEPTFEGDFWKKFTTWGNKESK